MTISKPTTYLRWLRKRVSQTNSRCKRLGVKGKLGAADTAVFATQLMNGEPCRWCGAALNDPRRVSLDHLLPISLGGENTVENLALVHRACNLLRGNMVAHRWSAFVQLLQRADFWEEFKRRYKPSRYRG